MGRKRPKDKKGKFVKWKDDSNHQEPPNKDKDTLNMEKWFLDFESWDKKRIIGYCLKNKLNPDKYLKLLELEETPQSYQSIPPRATPQEPMTQPPSVEVPPFTSHQQYTTQAQAGGQQTVIAQNESIRDFKVFKNEFNQLSEDDQILYASIYKISIPGLKLREQRRREKPEIRDTSPLKIYHDDNQLFAQHYLEMRPWEHQTEIFVILVKQNRVLILEPRDHGKTSCIIAYCIHQISFNRNIRIKYYSKNEKKAKQFVGAIKENLEHNNKLITDFGSFKVEMISSKRRGKWTGEQLYVDRTRIRPDPTVEALGLGSAGTGGRADIIIFDDIVDQAICESDIKREKIPRQIFAEIDQLLEPDGQQIVIGTRKHHQDIYSIIKENPGYHILERKAILGVMGDDGKLRDFTDDDYEVTYEQQIVESRVIDDELGNAEMVKHKKIKAIILKRPFHVLCPEKWDARKLLIKKTIIDYHEVGAFAREYQNDPTPLSGYWFKKTHMKTFKEYKYLLDKFPVYISGDLDISEKRTSDYFGYIVFAFDFHNYKYYVLDVVTGWGIKAGFNALFELKEKWHPITIFLETIATFIHLTETWARTLKANISYEKYQPTKKILRLKSLVPYWNREDILVHESVVEIWVNKELLKIPMTNDDHVTDAAELGFRKVAELPPPSPGVGMV